MRPDAELEGEEGGPEKKEVQGMDGLPSTSTPLRSWTTVNAPGFAQVLLYFSRPGEPVLGS